MSNIYKILQIYKKDRPKYLLFKSQNVWTITENSISEWPMKYKLELPLHRHKKWLKIRRQIPLNIGKDMDQLRQ